MAQAVVSAVLAAWLGASVVQAQGPLNNVDANLFPGITPKDTLEWHDCYGAFKCARLLVSFCLDVDSYDDETDDF